MMIPGYGYIPSLSSIIAVLVENLTFVHYSIVKSIKLHASAFLPLPQTVFLGRYST